VIEKEVAFLSNPRARIVWNHSIRLRDSRTAEPDRGGSTVLRATADSKRRRARILNCAPKLKTSRGGFRRQASVRARHGDVASAVPVQRRVNALCEKRDRAGHTARFFNSLAFTGQFAPGRAIFRNPKTGGRSWKPIRVCSTRLYQGAPDFFPMQTYQKHLSDAFPSEAPGNVPQL
jgi:hypothetical protein